MKYLAPFLLFLAAAVAQAAPPAPQPQAEHRWLQQLVGTWHVTSEATMAPGAEPMRFEFVESVRAIGDLWVQGESEATSGGVPMTAQITLGFDPAKKAFVGTWIDTTQTHLWVYRGSLDGDRKVLTLEAEGPSFDDPTKTSTYRDAIEIHGRDRRTLTSSVRGDDGTWTKFMTAEYRRRPERLETATLAGGCFWCIEAVLERIDGVFEVESGYMGGAVENPTYKDVCTGTTGHAEVVQVKFDPTVLPYGELLDWFFQLHDPTTLNRQGNDVGTQYRSAVFCHSPAQRDAAKAAVERAASHWRDPIVTEITEASTFWSAEGYHQDYWAKNPDDRYCNLLIPPKLKKLGLDGKAEEKGKAKK